MKHGVYRTTIAIMLPGAIARSVAMSLRNQEVP